MFEGLVLVLPGGQVEQYGYGEIRVLLRPLQQSQAKAQQQDGLSGARLAQDQEPPESVGVGFEQAIEVARMLFGFYDVFVSDRIRAGAPGGVLQVEFYLKMHLASHLGFQAVGVELPQVFDEFGAELGLRGGLAFLRFGVFQKI
ncbi:MAG: hypothetical protein H6575_13785 [Lewinellaceae bacterium]|nr:hypothetical protein [Lewinellaceae bacterium]